MNGGQWLFAALAAVLGLAYALGIIRSVRRGGR